MARVVILNMIILSEKNEVEGDHWKKLENVGYICLNAEEENDGRTLANSDASCYIFDDRLDAISGGLKKIKLAENMLHMISRNTVEAEIWVNKNSYFQKCHIFSWPEEEFY